MRSGRREEGVLTQSSLKQTRVPRSSRRAVDTVCPRIVQSWTAITTARHL